MAGQRSEFLTELIYQANPDINPTTTIHFDLIESTLKSLLLKFTTILFTKMNYGEIFASPITIPPHKIENRLKICLNMARLHLYLTNNFQSIDYIKFNEDFKLRPKRFKIDSKIECTDEEKEYFTISSDLRFNVKLLFNLPKTLFLEKFNIPSLKNSFENLINWFEKIFPAYSRQFDNSIDKQKTFTYLKHQIRQHFILHLAKLLPDKYEIKKPNSQQERQIEATRFSNHHTLTCTNETCKYLKTTTITDKPDTESKGKEKKEYTKQHDSD